MEKDKELKNTSCECENCTCDETCDCGCQEGKECTCNGNCSCGCDCDCDCFDIPPLDETYILFGKDTDKDTKEAIETLKKQKVPFDFVDIDEGNEISKIFEIEEIPSIIVLQSVIAGYIPGLKNIKDCFEEEDNSN